MRYAGTTSNGTDDFGGLAIEPGEVFEVAAAKSQQFVHDATFCTEQHWVGVELVPIVFTQDVIPVVMKAYRAVQ